MSQKRTNLTHDLVLPTLLFAALGGMTWAVRGCSGFGAVPGCLFAGVTWGAAWWYIAHDPSREQSRRYASGWIVLAVTLGVGLSGARGWMQWPSFFEGHIVTNSDKNEFLPIPREYGFLWLFIAGVPWAGLGACLLAWCGSLPETRVWHWILRIACGICLAALGRWLIETYPEHFLPLYRSLESRYHDAKANPSLRRLTNDCTAAFVHLGYYLGFLLYEVIRRDWKNTVLIATVGLLNGAGWALCQNWSWAPHVWPNAHFNFWRCWESSGGISIGIAFGVAYFLVNRPMSDRERALVATRRAVEGPNFEWLLVYLGLACYLDLFFGMRMAGWGNTYFAIVILLGAAYYLINSRSNEWMAALLAIAVVLGLFAPAIASVLPADLAARLPTARELLRIRGFYFAGVFVVGLAWYAAFFQKFEAQKKLTTPVDGDPNLERLGLFLGLLTGLGLSLRNGLKGWYNIYVGNEKYWDRVLWQYFGWAFLAWLITIVVSVLCRPIPRDTRRGLYPHAYGIIWLVLLLQNAIAQLVTGPLNQWTEVAFSIYYGLLFALTAVIVVHFHWLKTAQPVNPVSAGRASEGPLWDAG